MNALVKITKPRRMPKAHVQESRNRRKAKRLCMGVTAIAIQTVIKRWHKGEMLERMKVMEDE